MEFEKKMLDPHMRFLFVGKRNLYQNCKENLAFATRASQNFKKYLKIKNSFFRKLSAIDV